MGHVSIVEAARAALADARSAEQAAADRLRQAAVVVQERQAALMSARANLAKFKAFEDALAKWELTLSSHQDAGTQWNVRFHEIELSFTTISSTYEAAKQDLEDAKRHEREAHNFAQSEAAAAAKAHALAQAAMHHKVMLEKMHSIELELTTARSEAVCAISLRDAQLTMDNACGQAFQDHRRALDEARKAEQQITIMLQRAHALHGQSDRDTNKLRSHAEWANRPHTAEEQKLIDAFLSAQSNVEGVCGHVVEESRSVAAAREAEKHATESLRAAQLALQQAQLKLANAKQALSRAGSSKQIEQQYLLLQQALTEAQERLRMAQLAKDEACGDLLAHARSELNDARQAVETVKRPRLN